MKHVAWILLLLSFCRVCVFDLFISVSLMEGDSLTLHHGVKTNQQDRRIWYFQPSIADAVKLFKFREERCIHRWSTDYPEIFTCRITEMLESGIPASWTIGRRQFWEKILFYHMDDQCEERFRDSLKLDDQTGSLTITDTTTEHTGVYQLEDCSSCMFGAMFFCVSVHGVSAAKQDEMKIKSVRMGESVTLDPGEITPNDVMTWYFNETPIAEITGDQSKICTDDQCKERFRDRLKLDHQTGSLTITHTTNTDSGEYKLLINSNIFSSSIFSIMRSFSVSVTGFFGIGSDGVSVFMMEGDSVTLNTRFKRVQREIIMWSFNDSLIALFNGYWNRRQRHNLTWFTERFRDGLKLDHKTGSLTIKNTTTEHTGVYKLRINKSGKIRLIKQFSVFVHGVSAAERDEIKSGESVTLYPGVIKNPKDLMKWYHDDTLIAEISGDQSKICTDVQCKERFRDRLKLDHQTGSLTIMNTRNTHSGVHKLKISSGRISITKSFSVSVT